MVKQNRGFTLVEVLIASVILFMSVAVVSEIFRTSFVASEKAELRIAEAGLVPAMVNLIQEDIRQQTTAKTKALSGEGVLWGKAYRWQAERLAFAAPIDRYDVDTGKEQSYGKRYLLWQVSMSVGVEPKVRHYQFKEFSWVR